MYRFEATDTAGIVRGMCEVTIINVNDGAAGLPGPAGTSSYTHIAYANSADGTVDFFRYRQQQEVYGDVRGW